MDICEKSQVNNEHASGVTKLHISRSFLKGIIRHWQWENSCSPFYQPRFVSTKFLSIHNVKRRINFESVPKYLCKLQKPCLVEQTILAAKNKGEDDKYKNSVKLMDKYIHSSQSIPLPIQMKSSVIQLNS